MTTQTQPEQIATNRQYLGDSVYVASDPVIKGGVILTVEYGQGVTDKIYMEPEVVWAFVRYLRERSELQ